MNSEIRILIVDDEQDILEFLSYNLTKEGYQIETAESGEEALAKAEEFFPEMIILDIMMPGMDGIEVCSQLRENPEMDNTLIVFLTARNESFTQIAALEAGGDDYITKPITPRLLKSRVKAVVRRHYKFQQQNRDSVFSFGELTLDTDEMNVTVKEQKINLAKKEFDLLNLLVSRPGKVFKREEILSKVWGREVIVGDRTIDVHIRKLREKIGSHYIETYKGVGYKFKF